MTSSSWPERLGRAILANREIVIDVRARRWLGSGWGISALLGFLAPLYRGTVHVHGGVVLGAAVAVMVAVDAATRRPMVGLTMSASGLIAGSAIGYGLAAALTHRPMLFAIAVQMAIVAVFLTRLFLRELRPRSEPEEDPFWEEIRHLPKEEAQARVVARLQELTSEAQALNANLSRMQKGTNAMIVGGSVALIGGAILFLGGRSSSPETWAHVALATTGLGAVVVLAGAHHNWVVMRTQPRSDRTGETR